MLDNQKHLIKLHDTAGQEDYERLRQVIYKDVRNNLIPFVLVQKWDMGSEKGKRSRGRLRCDFIMLTQRLICRTFRLMYIL